MRRRNRFEAGEGQGGCLFGIVLLLIAAFIAYKLIPIKIHVAELRGVVVDEAKSAGTHGDERIRKAILAKAADENLPVTDENIQIDRTGNQIRINVDYTIPVVFPGYTYQWHVHHNAENPLF